MTIIRCYKHGSRYGFHTKGFTLSVNPNIILNEFLYVLSFEVQVDS